VETRTPASRSLRRTGGCAWVAALTLWLCGCAGHPSDEPSAIIEGLRRDAIVRREQVRAVVLNHLGHWNAVRKYEQMFRMFQVSEHIPVGPDLDRLTDTLREMATRCEFSSVEVEVTPEPAPSPALPRTVETPGGYAFRPDEVAAEVRATVIARPADLAKAECLVTAMLRPGHRFTRPSRVRLGGGNVVVEVVSWFFQDLTPPVQVLRAPDLQRDLADAGVALGPAPTATVAEQILDLTRLYGDTATWVAASGPSLAEAARANLLAARFDLFKQKVEQVQSVRFSDLLAP